MKDERSFWNGKKLRTEVWLERVMLHTVHIGWDVWELEVWERLEDLDDGRPGFRTYPATDEGYAAALKDYNERVDRRMRE